MGPGGEYESVTLLWHAGHMHYIRNGQRTQSHCRSGQVQGAVYSVPPMLDRQLRSNVHHDILRAEHWALGSMHKSMPESHMPLSHGGQVCTSG